MNKIIFLCVLLCGCASYPGEVEYVGTVCRTENAFGRVEFDKTGQLTDRSKQDTFCTEHYIPKNRKLHE